MWCRMLSRSNTRSLVIASSIMSSHLVVHSFPQDSKRIVLLTLVSQFSTHIKTHSEADPFTQSIPIMFRLRRKPGVFLSSYRADEKDCRIDTRLSPKIQLTRSLMLAVWQYPESHDLSTIVQYYAYGETYFTRDECEADWSRSSRTNGALWRVKMKILDDRKSHAFL